MQNDSVEPCVQPLIGLARIMRHAFQGSDLTPLTQELVHRVQFDPRDASAMLDLSIVLQIDGQHELAAELQTQAITQQQVFELASNSDLSQLRLLAIMGPGEVMANTPLEFLIENSDVALTLLYLGEGLPTPKEIPEHDVAFVCVCESDRNQPLLAHLSQTMNYWPRPFINQPEKIARLSRDSVSHNLADVESVVASHACRLDRTQIVDRLSRLEAGYPMIIRPVNSHAGHGLAKVDNRSEVESYLAQQEALEFYCAQFVDYRSPDGWFRKYRVAVIDGQPFAAHMAISQNWMVHYLNADMLNNSRNRQEEAEFMASFEHRFANKHRRALKEIDRLIGLDYYSIDCAETLDGSLLVFEIDSGAVVHSMDPIDIFPYKPQQMEKVFAAFCKMLRQRAACDQLKRAG